MGEMVTIIVKIQLSDSKIRIGELSIFSKKPTPTYFHVIYICIHFTTKSSWLEKVQAWPETQNSSLSLIQH